MAKIVKLIFTIMLYQYSLAQTSASKIDMGHQNRFVYFVDIGKKLINNDSTYSYSDINSLQICSKKALTFVELNKAIKERLLGKSLNNAAYIDSGLLILDYIRHNDSTSYKLLRPIKDGAVPIKFSSEVGRSYHAKIDDREYSISVSVVEGEWTELIISKELAQSILGRTILLFSENIEQYHLFVLIKQQKAYHISNFKE
jgi:hypothetical protein